MEDRRYEAQFVGHAAKVSVDTERFFGFDFADKDGSKLYAVSFLVDKEKGTLMVDGDIGSCVARWDCGKLAPEKVHGFLADPGYLASKIKASSDLYRYSEETVREDVEDYFAGRFDGDEAESTKKAIIDEIVGTLDWQHGYPDTGRLRDAFRCIAVNSLGAAELTFGRRLAPRVYLWAAAYRMGYRQLADAGQAPAA